MQVNYLHQNAQKNVRQNSLNKYMDLQIKENETGGEL